MNRVASCFAAFTFIIGMTVPAMPQTADALRVAVDASHRADAAKARDGARHPYETLRFFGVAPTMTVIEILPGGPGYWTEILAPALAPQGRYIAALDPDGGPGSESLRGNTAFRAKIAGAPALYGKVQTISFNAARDALEGAPMADAVLTFRNLHNWITRGTAEAVLRSFHAALKPGGVLGIEDHRARTDQPEEVVLKAGYVPQALAVSLAEKVGFRLVAASEVNANAKDTKDHPAGVWTLPPTFRLGDTDREKYRAIGESDRFTLLFRKPAP